MLYVSPHQTVLGTENDVFLLLLLSAIHVYTMLCCVSIRVNEWMGWLLTANKVCEKNK